MKTLLVTSYCNRAVENRDKGKSDCGLSENRLRSQSGG